MDFKKEFYRIMKTATELALSTAVDNVPNVRFVSFVYDEVKKVAYFSTFRKSPKTEEFAKNNKVAFATVPMREEMIRVKEGIVQKSEFSVFDLQEMFVSKSPDYQQTIDKAGPMLDIYEIHFKDAHVTMDFQNNGEISL